jgi:hypothetical protein
MLANASRESLLDGGAEDRRASSHVKKPSMISSLRKSGLSNIMNYTKDVMTPATESTQPRPATATSDRDVNDRSSRAYPALVPNRDYYPPPLRPRTATAAASPRCWGEVSVTALPPPPPEPAMPLPAKSSTFEVARKKSFSALRNRSSSIGKALRSASSSVVHYPGKPGATAVSNESWSQRGSMDLAAFPFPSQPSYPQGGARR